MRNDFLLGKHQPKKGTAKNRYAALIEKVFFDRYSEGDTEIPFQRSDFDVAAEQLGFTLPKNLGDVVYSVRYRTSMPDSVLETQTQGREWLIEGAGRGRYLFRLVRVNRILPSSALAAIQIPDATPSIVSACALSDEQALLAKIRYNRIIDIFLGITSYSLQNHLRTTVQGIGQIEIDELYVGIDSDGNEYVLPVQAKGRKDQLSSVQTRQDIHCCAEKFPDRTCRPVSAQFLYDDTVAMFELASEGEEICVVTEKHYQLRRSEAA